MDFTQLENDGFMIIPGLVTQDELDQFEMAISTLVRRHGARLNVAPSHDDPFEDLFSIGGAYTKELYVMMERLDILQAITARISDHLKEAGFFDWAQIDVPLVWPDVRADLKSTPAHTLPVHQDFASIHSENAWRLWVPLRPSNRELGSMRAYPGTHKRGVVGHNVSDPLYPQIDAEHYQGINDVVFDLPAGDCVVMNPLLFHASVPNSSNTTKFTLMVQIQDLATMIDPSDQSSPYYTFAAHRDVRQKARQAAAAKPDGVR